MEAGGWDLGRARASSPKGGARWRGRFVLGFWGVVSFDQLGPVRLNMAVLTEILLVYYTFHGRQCGLLCWNSSSAPGGCFWLVHGGCLVCFSFSSPRQVHFGIWSFRDKAADS